MINFAMDLNLREQNIHCMDIKKKIRDRGLTLEDVGNRMSKRMSQQSMSALLKDGGNPSINRLREIADIIGMSLSELVSDEESDFVAMVSEGGKCYRADSVVRLSDILNTLGYDAEIKRKQE